jgi:uncharacterized peroxidase-related enzyme
MFLNEPSSVEAHEYLDREKAAMGYVMDLERGWAWRPDVAEAFRALRKQLADGSTLSPSERAVLVCAQARALGDSCCATAWGTRLAELTNATTAADVLRGLDAPALSPREAALRRWADQVVRAPNDVQAADIEVLRSVGLTDGEIFEATAFIAFRLAFSTVNDALGARPDGQLVEAAPSEVRTAITYGRPQA